MRSGQFAALFVLLLALVPPHRLLAQSIPATGGRPVLFLDDDDDDQKPATTNPASNRYFFGLLDHRSVYGSDFFPDPLIGPEFDADQQIEVDYAHSEKRGVVDDEVDGGFQWNVVGELTIAAEAGWESDHESNSGDTGDSDDGGSGAENIDLAVYHPIFQFVSDNHAIDYSAVARLDVGIPTRTPVSGDDAQLTPYIGHLLRLGDHICIEAWTGSQFTIAPEQTNQFIYGGLLGYAIDHQQLPLPWIARLTPFFEFDGQTPYSSNGQDALTGIAGMQIYFHAIGEVQPELEIGCELPLDQGARDEADWGIITQISLDF
ncbi:MAG TPA: hypothetical protein VL992_11160 [Tepidisphaeraceae bacterium]|nr:hypothetical protein [Tepidisphaeraceae bacterium]